MVSSYAFKLAYQSIVHEKWINLLSILTITAGLFISALIFLSVYNMYMVTKRLPEKFSVILYLKDDLSQEELEHILYTLKSNDSIETVEFIPKGEALLELKTTLKDAAYIIEGLEGNPLLDSMEVRLKREAVGPDTVKRLAAEMRAIEGVDEVEYGEKFLSSLYSITVGMRTIGIIFIIVISAGMIFACYSTVKILFYRRGEEISAYKLLGATKGFIRAPFIIEGAVIGFGGGFLCLIGTLFLYYTIFLRLTLSIPLFKVLLFPVHVSLFFPLIGLILGMAGAAIAVGKIRF